MNTGLTFLDILEARELPDPVRLNELSLSRAYELIKNRDSSFGIITAYRAEYSPKENQIRFETLKKELRALNLGFSLMKGIWQSCLDQEVAYEDCPKDKLVNSVEPSLFVFGIKQEDIEKLMREWSQDAVVYGTPDEGVKLLFLTGGDISLGEFKPNTIAQAMSQLKGSRSFTFEALASNFSESLVEQLWNNNNNKRTEVVELRRWFV